MSSTRRRAQARAAASVASAAVVGLAVLTVVGCTTVSAGPATTSTAAPGAPSPASAVATTPELAPESWAAARGRAVTELLRTRFAAAGRADEAAWLAPLRGASSTTLRTTQAAVLDRMTRMRVSGVRLVDVRETAAPVPAARGTAVEWDVRASLTYRLRGFDAAPRSFDLDLTLKADPARPDGLVITGSAPSGRPQPWDLAGLVVSRSDTALVLAVGDEHRVEEVVRRARTAAARVATVWGDVHPAVWIAPATDADAARLLGRTAGDLDGVAAATDGPLTPGEKAGADRIVLVPGALASLRPDGRDVVMTHELTHVTVRASTTRAVPVWLSEGFAELVAYAPIDLPEATIVGPALDHVRTAGVPRVLPADADFDPGTHALAAAYGLSLLALRTLADAHGTQSVVRLYRAAAGGLEVPMSRLDDREAAVDAALRSTTDTTRTALVRDWQARIRDLLR